MSEIQITPEDFDTESKKRLDDASREDSFKRGTIHESTSPTLTLRLLHFVAGTGLFVGVVGGIFLLWIGISSGPAKGEYLLVLGVAAIAQGVVVFALFNAIALIVESLVGIRDSLMRSEKKYQTGASSPSIQDLEK